MLVYSLLLRSDGVFSVCTFTWRWLNTPECVCGGRSFTPLRLFLLFSCQTCVFSQKELMFVNERRGAGRGRDPHYTTCQMAPNMLGVCVCVCVCVCVTLSNTHTHTAEPH